MKMLKSSFAAILYLLLYAIIFGSGIFGYGIDVQLNYMPGKVTSFNLFDTIGAWVAVLRFESVYLGVFIVTLALISSVTLFYSTYLRIPRFKTALYLTPFFLSWPIILPSINALRQGLSTALFVYFLHFYYNVDFKAVKKSAILLLTALLVAFSHKIGILLLFCFCIVLLYSALEKIKAPNSVILFFTVSAFTLGLFVVLGIQFNDYSSRSVGLDLRPLLFPLLLWSFWVGWRSFKDRLLTPTFSMSFFLVLLYIMSGLFALYGFSYQVERLVMFSFVLLVPQNLLFFRSIFKKTNSAINLLAIGIVFFLITIAFTPIYTTMSTDYA